ncbi:MAG TPA: ABC transporter substrate-binding protein, partial [Pyrinomonadaceae bacterium]
MLAPETILQNRYRVVCQLGQGGMGTVYEAVDERLDTTVALKETFFTDERLRNQFEREARLLARLHHPALPRVSDHFMEGDGQFLVMQFISGEDLLEMLQRQGGPFTLEDVLRWADQLLDALDYLHTQEPSIIHRDIKPQNLKLTARGQVILLDFGLAKGFAGPMSRVSASSSIFGFTPHYAPLEQIQGMGTDPRSDLYSLAATLYHLMTGVPPPDVLTRLTATTDGQPDPLRSANEVNQRVPAGVAAILDKALAIGRNQRPTTAAEMRGALLDASQSRMLADSNEAKAEVLPPTIVSPALQQGTREQGRALVPPTASESDLSPTPQEPSATVASPTVAAPTSPPLVSPTESAPFPAVTHPLMPSVQPTQKSNRLSWIIGGFVALLVVGILIALMTSRDALDEHSSPSSSQAAAKGNIKVGIYTPVSGQISSFGQSTVNGIKMAADEINKAGGVGGRQVELVIEDDQSRPEQAATVVTKLINQDKVIALLGEVASSNSLAAAPKAQAAKVPMITPSSTNPKVTQVGDYIFRVCFIDP